MRDETLVRISPAGAAHLRLVYSDNVYISQMALVTALTSEAVSISIREEAQKTYQGWMKICDILLAEIKQEDCRVFPAVSEELYPWIVVVRNDIDQLHQRIIARRLQGGKRRGNGVNGNA